MSTDPQKPAEPPPPAPEKAGSLDAYTEFLHLLPGPRPPHLYQLLELEIFCPHPEQIQHAVRKQFRKVKPYAEHPDRAVRDRIQDVMSHIATAQVVLTDPEQKRCYDDLLARHLHIDREKLVSARPAARLPEYELTVVAGPSRVGERLELLPDRIITIGADPHAQLSLPSSRMGDIHAQLEHNGISWALRMVQQANNIVLVNDETRGDCALTSGDSIELGGFRLAFTRLGAKKPSPATLPPPLSMVIRRGPNVPEAICNALPPVSIVIGQGDTALWQLAHRSVSRLHARVFVHDAVWEIEDLRSAGGVFINTERTTRSVLNHRDLLTIGDFELQVNLRR